MKSNLLKVAMAAAMGAAISMAPGCSGTDGNSEELVDELFILLDNLVEEVINLLEETTGLDLSGLEETLEDILGLEDGGLVGLQDLLDSGELDGLLELGEDDETVGGLLGILDELLGGGLLGGDVLGGGGGLLDGLALSSVNAVDAADQVSVQQAPELRQALISAIAEFRSQIDDGLPGGLTQFTGGMHTIGEGLMAYSTVLPGTGDGADSVRALSRAIGRIFVSNAERYTALGNLDGAGYTNATLATMDAFAQLASELPGNVGSRFANPLEITRTELESTRLPLIRALFTALRQTSVGNQFDDVMAGVLRGDLSEFGGREGLQEILNGSAVGGLPGGAPLPNLRDGLGNVGDLFGPVAGLPTGGNDALGDILQTGDGLTDGIPNFAGLVPQIPGLEGLTPGQSGNLIEGLLSPDIAGGLTGAIPGDLPINNLGSLGLLDGNVLGNLTQIGGLLSGLGGLGGGLGGLGDLTGGLGGLGGGIGLGSVAAE